MAAGLSVLMATLSLTGCEPTLGVYDPPIAWQASVAVGRPNRGTLRRAVQVPAQGPNHLTYDPARRSVPNRPWRRWGTDRTVRTTLCVIEEFRHTRPDAPRVLIGDVSLPHGGPFGPRYGGLGHVSHQNGRDIDVYYPRWDLKEAAPKHLADVDLVRAQELVDRFVAAGATLIVVGPDTGLVVSGRRTKLERRAKHDDHMHVRFPAPRPGTPIS